MWFALYCRLNVHVLDSDRTVIRAAFRRMSKSARLRCKEAKQLRKDAYRELLKQHRDALELFLHVARGD